MEDPYKQNISTPDIQPQTSQHTDIISTPKRSKKLRIAIVLLFAVIGSFLIFRSFAATTLAGSDGEYIPVPASRILDTRVATGVTTTTPIAAGGTIAVQMTGRGGVPASNVRAVLIDLTAINGTTTGGLIVWPSGATRPTSESLSFYTNSAVTNQITVPVGADGKIQIYNTAGTTHAIAQVVGYISNVNGPRGSRLEHVASTRILDTRSANGVTTTTPIAAGGTIAVQMTGRGGVPSSNVKAVVIELSSNLPTNNGGFAVWPTGATRPVGNSLSFNKGVTMTNQITVPVGTDGKIQIYNTTGTTHAVAQVVGYYTNPATVAVENQAGRTVPLVSKTRILDTRSANGVTTTTPIAAGGTIAVQMTGRGGVPASEVKAVVLEINTLNPTAIGGLTVWPTGASRPVGNAMTFSTNAGYTNQITVPVGTDGKIQIYNTAGSTHVTAQVAGYLAGPAAALPQVITNGFIHPGILMNSAQLSSMKSKVNASQQPTLNAYNQLKGSSLASKTYTPKPVAKLMCSTTTVLADNPTYPQAGCVDIVRDSSAAYAQALMWQITGDSTYAANAIKIMNAWSSTLTEIPFDQPRHPGPNCVNCEVYWQNMLLVGWSSESITRAAEIIRYSNAGWQAADITKFESFLKNKYYPIVSIASDGMANGGQTWSEALVNIGIFTNDRTIFDRGIKWWRGVSKAMIYVNRDGVQPAYTKNWDTGASTYIDTPTEQKNIGWWGATSYINGLESETCRDIGHTYMGLGGMSNVAETARIQGLDLYGDPEYQDRFLASYELNANYTNQLLDQMAATGQTAKQVSDSPWIPSGVWPCPNFKDGGTSAYIGHVLAYNHFAVRRGIAMPNTKKVIDRMGPQAGGNHLLWETLTHTGAP